MFSRMLAGESREYSERRKRFVLYKMMKNPREGCRDVDGSDEGSNFLIDSCAKPLYFMY
jgi:hypothetical protein